MYCNYFSHSNDIDFLVQLINLLCMPKRVILKQIYKIQCGLPRHYFEEVNITLSVVSSTHCQRKSVCDFKTLSISEFKA